MEEIVRKERMRTEEEGWAGERPTAKGETWYLRVIATVRQTMLRNNIIDGI
jgi:hypothetical protein